MSAKKKIKINIAIIMVMLLVIAVWLVSCFFNAPPVEGNGPDPGPNVSGSPAIMIPPDDKPPDTTNKEQEDAARRLAEQLEAERLEAERMEKRAVILEQAGFLARGYFFDEALSLLNADEELINSDTMILEERIVEAANGLERFEGEIKHIFFHSLILYPEHLFPNLREPTGGYNEGFAYQSELIKILPQLHERGYVLYNINDIFSKDENGNMRQNDIYLPPGKKPLVLSIDDPTYHYGIGFANRMLLDEHGELATEVITPARETIITYDGDVQLVVDAFVREHPEF